MLDWALGMTSVQVRHKPHTCVHALESDTRIKHNDQKNTGLMSVCGLSNVILVQTSLGEALVEAFYDGP